MIDRCDNKECLDQLGYLPSLTGKFRHYEQLGLRVRSFVNLKIHDRLNPLQLAQSVGLLVLSPSDLENLSEEARRILSDPAQWWSGGVTPELPDGSRVVLLNPGQSPQRQAATLMEEVCHVLLGHRLTRIVNTAAFNEENYRDYNDSIEEEAYSVGSASLVPYRSLVCNLSRGYSIKSIAAHFGVTVSLVKYRIRVLKLIGQFA